MSLVDSVPTLQCPIDADVSLSLNGRVNLLFSFVIAYYQMLLHVTAQLGYLEAGLQHGVDVQA